MKKGLYISLVMLFTIAGFSQDRTQYFDGADTLEWTTLKIDIDTTAGNIWQIGPPNKLVFDSAYTLPNALVTDTLNTYPNNNESAFTFGDLSNIFDQTGISAIQWQQKLDMEPGDGGIIEYTEDSINWYNVFDNPYVYNFYGFDTANVDTLFNGQVGFTGTDTTWRDIWLCFQGAYLLYHNYVVRFRFVSDSVGTGKDGWMIDNFYLHNTIFHTVAEKEQEEYLKVFPTVTTGRVYIEARKLQEFHIIESLEVYDLDGKLVQQHQVVPTKFFIDLDDQPNGTYIVKIKTNKQTESFKISLQK